MKTYKKILPLAMAGVVLLNATMPSLAVSEPTQKEEVIYINLTANGSVKDVYAVNIFGKGEVTDYGDYSAVEMLNTTDEISLTGDLITFSTSADRAYYKGKLTDTEIPWNISIRYFIDDKEYSAKEIAGKSGNLKIRFQVTENKDAAGDFFENYALQASFTLDTEKCSDIVAAGATLANVGSKKQISYTMLPGKGIDATITADVKNFEMAAVSINGVPLSMDVEIDDAELMEEVNKLLGAVVKLDDGAGDLMNGAGELSDGTSTLSAKVGELYSGVGKLSSGTAALSNGLSAIVAQNQQLLDGAYAAFKVLCTASETILNTELTKNGLSAVTLTPETYEDVLKGLLKAMDADNIYNTAYNQALDEVTTEVNQNADALYAGCINSNADALDSLTDEQKTEIRNAYIEQMMKSEEVTSQITAAVSAANTAAASVVELKGQLDNYSLFYEGLKSYTSAVSDAANGANTLKFNMSTLYKNIGTLNTSVIELNDGAKELFNGTTEFKDGTAELRAETNGMDTKISDQIDDMIENITGGNAEVSSFVSEKNTNVKAVQFVIQTEAVEINGVEADAPVVEEKLTFWQKLLRLFGLY